MALFLPKSVEIALHPLRADPHGRDGELGQAVLSGGLGLAVESYDPSKERVLGRAGHGSDPADPPGPGGRRAPAGTNSSEIELTQWRTFRGVNPSPSKT